MEVMVKYVDRTRCPACGRGQFVVAESNTMAYLTDINGDILDSKELRYSCIGKCNCCGSEFNMYPLPNRFVPIPRTIQLIEDYSLLVSEEDLKTDDGKPEDKINPMGEEK